MRIRVGDCVWVRLAQDPSHLYMGAVSCLQPIGRKIEWEANTDQKLRIGMHIMHHSDAERTVILPEDTIVQVLAPEEWQTQERFVEFVRGKHKTLLRVIENHYGTLKAPWSESNNEIG